MLLGAAELPPQALPVLLPLTLRCGHQLSRGVGDNVSALASRPHLDPCVGRSGPEETLPPQVPSVIVW